MGAIKLGDGLLICAKPTLTFGAGTTDVVGKTGQFDLGVAPTGRAQAAHDDDAHIGCEGVRIPFALKPEGTQEMVGAKADRIV